MSETKKILEELFAKIKEITEQVKELNKKQDAANLETAKQLEQINHLLHTIGVKIDLSGAFVSPQKKPTKAKAASKSKDDVKIDDSKADIEIKVEEDKTEIARWPPTSDQKKQSGINKVVFFNRKYNEDPTLFETYITEDVKQKIQSSFAKELSSKNLDEKKSFLCTQYYRYMSANHNDALISMKNAYNAAEHSKTKKIAVKETTPISVENIMDNLDHQTFEDFEEDFDEDNDNEEY